MRLFPMEHSLPEDMDQYWAMMENTYYDVSTYPYAWIEIIMKDPKRMQESLDAVRILLCYAEHLVTNPCHKNAKKALHVLHITGKAVNQLLITMKDETGDERWSLSLQEYKQKLYTSLAFASLGHKKNTILYFQVAVNMEQGHRILGQLECKDQHVTYFDDETLEMLGGEQPSLLYILSSTLKIKRRLLDESHPFGEEFWFKLNEKQVYSCLEWFNVTAPSKTEEYCQVCWSTSPSCNLKKCSQCKKVSYCGRECQFNDWKDHKKACCSV
eukprot:Sro154_g070100.1 n/a (270) ;mRNA; r:68802-69611